MIHWMLQKSAEQKGQWAKSGHLAGQPVGKYLLILEIRNIL